MTKQLTKIQRFRFTAEMDEDLNKLRKYGINKSHFVRQAIADKLANDMPQIIDQHKKIRLPF